MNSINDTYKLSNGVEIPCVGFGTWQTPDGETAVKAVTAALEAGYTHIDTAEGYENEGGIGKAIEESGVSRDKLFLTSKLWNEYRGYDVTVKALEQTLKDLRTDYLDLFLIHWPNPLKFRDQWQKMLSETWRAFEDLYKAGKVRAIGVSNFRQHHFEELAKTAEIMPMVNQIRLCPGCTQDEVVEYCRSKGMLLEAYSPLGIGKIFEVPEMRKLAEKYGRSIAQICINWSLRNGWLPLPKSVTPSRIEENTRVFDFTLEDEDVKLIAGLTGCVGLARDPDTAPF